MKSILIAGKDLDVQIAKILGLEIVCLDWPCGKDYETGRFHAICCRAWVDGCPDYTPYPIYKPEWGFWPPEKQDIPSYKDGDNVIAYVEPIPFYSTDIATAMVAMEWVWQHRPWASIYRIEGGYAIDTDMPPWISGNTVSAETLPLAICAAILTIDKHEKEKHENDDPD